MSNYDHVIIRGGFDPIHPGHVYLIQEAARLCDCGVIVLLNRDDWLTRKKGVPFMPWADRAEIIRAISGVKEVIPVDDRDGTVISGIIDIAWSHKGERLAFANGGDRYDHNTPEANICRSYGIDQLYGVGGDKVRSRSDYLNNWKGLAERSWGRWATVRNGDAYKVKLLEVEPGRGTRLQAHEGRDEVWVILEGYARVHLGETRGTVRLGPKQVLLVEKGQTHQLTNQEETRLLVLEVQIGICREDDIVRFEGDLGRDGSSGTDGLDQPVECCD